MFGRLRDFFRRKFGGRRRTARQYQPAGRPDAPKIFCIGFHKTGTTSLKHALKMLGYRTTGPNLTSDPAFPADIEDKLRALVRRFDAFQDMPWPVFYRFLDREYPGSRFILTVRPTDAWIASVKGHFNIAPTAMREWIYGPGRGSPLGNEDVYIERYERHNREVRAYFADRPGDLLVLDLTAGDGWEKLCPFLGDPVPDRPFPRDNSREEIEAAIAGRGAELDVQQVRRTIRERQAREKFR